ncbi:hypothetical protein CC78DRAFT_588497 [Lojkania enalia]|uniref:Uncharacterized protein n=1 Tax=Lojkania enalia TaxID=147567 RepID=A0A9P4JW40_9PLEO|nr:hypothetical protein CC78DRAFT_588497 [Didymosphaeria enalia]
MEPGPIPSKISRIDSRYRHLAQDLSRKEVLVHSRELLVEKNEQVVDEPLLVREQKGRAVMGRAHRMFHRRQAVEPANVLTMVVEVIATVDVNGNVIAQQTNPPILPSVPPLPTDPLPQVPSVPSFPSLEMPKVPTVVAYPFTSGELPISPTTTSLQNTVSAPLSTAESSPHSSAVPSLGFNSTSASSILATSHLLPSTNRTVSTSTSLSTSFSQSSSSKSSTSSIQSSSSRVSPTSSVPVSSEAPVVPGGGGDVFSTAAPAETTAATGGSAGSNDGGPLDTPKVVGSVIGSLAGAALLLALILLLIKRYKQQQRRGAVQLPENDTADNQALSAAGQPMAARSSFVPPAAAAFFSRFSGASRSTADATITGERGFQRISGRKLPSAFSEGMTSEQFSRGEGTLSGSSFYRDDTGFYGGPGIVKEFEKDAGKEVGESSTAGAMGTKERIMPSPARTPVIHHPEDAPPFGTSRNGGGTLSPPLTPNTDRPPRPTLGRSHPSHDGSRGSRFTEDV